MKEKQLFEYAIIRVVPRVEREEFFNAGVILYCAALNFLAIKYEVNEMKLKNFCALSDSNDVKEILSAFEKICLADASSGPIALLSPAARFRWLTSARSTIIQTSPVHPGFSNDITITLNKIFDELVK